MARLALADARRITIAAAIVQTARSSPITIKAVGVISILFSYAGPFFLATVAETESPRNLVGLQGLSEQVDRIDPSSGSDPA
ncbi:hypothetical protein MACH24_18570 [Erythrobacter sp. Dej080120_24]|nr:hypothetical protein MACH24_18570 [Erythrobacter sp. Dej080120_24]